MHGRLIFCRDPEHSIFPDAWRLRVVDAQPHSEGPRFQSGFQFLGSRAIAQVSRFVRGGSRGNPFSDRSSLAFGRGYPRRLRQIDQRFSRALGIPGGNIGGGGLRFPGIRDAIVSLKLVIVEAPGHA